MAEWTTQFINDLPDSAFACPEQRKYPHHDASGKLDLPHLRAALSRVGDPSNEQCGKGHLEAHAKAEGMGERGKALMPLKAQTLDDEEMTAWFDGRHPRRLLAIPFGGPIPSPKAPMGVDLDGEWFSGRTDIYGGVKALLDTRERLTDWHHASDPSGLMGSHVIGKSVLDPDPDEDGWWVDLWLKTGDKRVQLIRRLAERGAQLFGSSQASRKTTDPDTGEITEWPFYLETLTTSPQNTYSVLRPKAVLQALDDSELDISPAMRDLLGELDALGASLHHPSSGRGDDAKAARELSALRGLDKSLGAWESMRDDLRRSRNKEDTD